MDIKITHSLLTKYLETFATPEQIAKCLSLCGPTVDRLEAVEDDWIYHIEVITNRVDSASVYGIAREASAILPEFGHKAGLKKLDFGAIEQSLENLHDCPLDIKIVNNPRLNQRILAVKVSGVKIGPSPAWLQSALTKLGQRPLNNVIDVTNYVMFELGHPVHVFDYDCLVTKKIVVREAVKGEQLTTLDGKTHILVGGEIVYDDGKGTIVDLPGIMGTANSVISNQTTNVLFWIEDNDGLKIRSASLIHQLRTNAAQLNEKQVDPELAKLAMLRTVELGLEVSGGKLASELVDIYPEPRAKKQVTISLSWLARLAGIEMEKSKVINILEKLGFEVTDAGEELVCVVPSFRWHDIDFPEDLAEEIMRVYGYFRLPSVLPITGIPSIGPDWQLSLEQETRLMMAKMGLTEIYNSPLVSKELLNHCGWSEKGIFRLVNPLSVDYEYMRPTLIPSLLINLSENRGLKTKHQKIFELSNIYLKKPKEKLAEEIPTLTWLVKGGSYQEAKGWLESLMKFWHLKYQIEKIEESGWFELGRAGEILVQGKKVGKIGSVAEQVLAGFRLEGEVWAVELDFGKIGMMASLVHHFYQVPMFPPVIEDLTFVLPTKTEAGKLIEEMQTMDKLIWGVELKDIYQQNHTFTITYQRCDRGLTNEEIEPIRKKIVVGLKAKGIELVGKV